MAIDQLYRELQWLPQPPHAFSERLRAAERNAISPGGDLQVLASHALNLNQLTKLAKVIEKARSERKPLDPLVPFRLAMLSNSTTEMIAPALVASCARYGFALEIVQSSYDQVAQEALAPDSR